MLKNNSDVKELRLIVVRRLSNAIQINSWYKYAKINYNMRTHAVVFKL